MNEEEKKAIDILKDFTENEDTKYCYDWQGFDHETILGAISLLLNLLNKNQDQLKRSNDYLDFYQDLCNKQNTLLKNVCTPYGLDKVHYVFMSYKDSNGEDRRLEIHNENISDKIYKEGDNNE